MKAYIEINARYHRGYQIRFVEGNETMVFDHEPFTLAKATFMAKHAAGIKEEDARDSIKIDRESVLMNRGFDELSGRMAKKLEDGG